MSKFGSLRDMIGRFRKDQSGNILMLFGLALVPLMGVVGVAVDYSRASNARQSLNAAIDSAALMAARDAQKLTDAQLTARVNAWLKDNLPADVKSEFTDAQVSIDRTARTVKIVANAQVPTTIARVLGTDNLAVSSSSQSTWGLNTIELALVLDNTGSMSANGKMAALKQASLDLIQIMKDATQETDQIRISIVPFSTRVVLDTSLKTAPWLRWDQTQTTCSSYWPYTCTTTTITKAAWQGCVTDRDKSYDVTDGDGSPNNSMMYPADFCDTYSPSTQAKILPLTSDWSALTARVNTMQPTGATNITIGAIWGMATLSPSDPFTEAKPASTPRLKKYMILLTDGDNTKNRWDGNGSASSSAVDARTTLACNNIKATGVTVYTIRVMDGNATLLRNCASDPAMYYEVTAASQLSPIFKSIAGEISQVRLTQ
ncbi:VWA domain-containing protein [Bosea sp. SSUT16]|uniref:VWA domain-containing protein n=1 Tax=Bosea spartocytisi TaxID=2773451 RepID=A0A927EFN2_9HYPH|nr:pilus assembly protein [Bosea spartocytisi]MBD3848746.1 VWA domain-containing protein [Bosea spartocytisi]MCT4473794.1 pilus assembly protein [Bosea spartocytisi]